MKIDLYINEANDYARDIGAPVYHPHVSVIHYDEMGKIRHSLNRINCFGIFLQREFPEGLTTIGNKELLIIPGASHVDLYDDAAGVIPFDKLENFFKSNLKK